MLRIVADSAIPYLQGVLEPYAEVEYLPGKSIAEGDVRRADAMIVRTRTQCDAALLEGSAVRLIATATIGFDHIDRSWCQSHGIEVVTAAGCNARGVLQWMGAALAWLSQRQGWQPAQRTLGVVGVGHVGSLVLEYAARWGFRTLACDPPRREREGGDFLPLDEVVRRSDLLTFHTPLDASTRRMVDDRLLGIMPPQGVLLNTSRGEVVDTQALLRSGRTCLLDVWENEPAIDGALLDRALLATPHIAGYSAQGKANATAAAVHAVAARFGLPLTAWYPPQVAPSAPCPIDWPQLCATIGRRFDIAALSRRLKARPEDFERMRDTYDYRQEYF